MSRLMVSLVCAVSLLVASAEVASAQKITLPGEGDKLAHFHLSGTLAEKPSDMPLDILGGESITSLKELLEQLDKARTDESVKAVVLTIDKMGMGFAQLEELRQALSSFKVVNKRVFVHVDEMSTGSFALLSAVSDLSVVPTADIWLTGFYAEGMYLKGLLDKIGVEADIMQFEDYKSAGELLTRTGPSEAAAENVNWLLDGLYEDLVGMIAESRDLSAGQVKRLIDDGPYSAERALKAGLIDSVQYRDEFLAGVRKVYGETVTIDNRYAEDKGPAIDFTNPFSGMMSLFSEMFGEGKGPHKEAIGIVYVEGMIQPGFGQKTPFGDSGGAFSSDIRKALHEAAEDPSVKAVVLRVDSPGGSALASEIIWRATLEVQKKKPLVVSMGNVAGSGGYYVACGAETIFADQTTITASIGVVGGKLVTTGMWDKLGVNWVPYKRGANADLLNTASPFDDEQRARLRDWMEEIYNVFKDHVVAGRGDKLKKPIEELAGGRVFTGGQALELGLVDKIGGLSDAVAFAAKKASISDYEVRVVPESKNFFDMLLEELSGGGDRASDIEVGTRLRLFGPTNPLQEAILPMLRHLDPQRTEALIRGLQRLELIHTEGVITMMPQEIVIR